MASELINALFKRKKDVDSAAEIFESNPAESSADASHLASLSFNAPQAQEWLRQLGKTPEEDMLEEALADGLSERKQALPAHAPAGITPEEAEGLRELAAALVDMQQRFNAERDGLGEVREELTRREAELRERERTLEAEQERLRQREEARLNYPPPDWLENVEGTINIGVVGNAGVGKSLLINKIRRVRPHATGWAPVGVNETTSRPTPYTFPSEPRVKLWDLPGSGTEKVPNETYVQNMGLRYFDKVLIVTAGRFTSTEMVLRTELDQHEVPYFMLRSKVDLDVWNNKEDNNLDEHATLAQIKDDFSRNNVAKPYLLSSRDPELYDFPRLMEDLFPGLKRRMDPTAPAFCPAAPAWNEPWALPPMLSNVLAGMQGRWVDAYNAVYLIQGDTVHVTLHNNQSAIVPLVQTNDCVWWCSRWFVSEDGIMAARRKMELRWSPSNLRDKPLVWWWSD
mmetsp:Transcript_60658/g.130206  ORF Transcript_60658/g.130206 Transcript_60658/m.130206 type:complete len:455 (-) Transcript_60658:86-1450(-)